MSKQYVVFSDLTYTDLDSAEVWVAPKGTHSEKSEYTGADIVDGIDECNNEPQKDLCKRYNIAAMVAECEKLGILSKFIAE